jgi:hypothetical protein
MEENPKEKFEHIKKVFYQSGISALLYKDKIEVTPKFIRDFEYLINLVDQMDKRNHIESINKIEKLKSIKDYEMISFIDIIKTLCENREKINEIIERVVK